MAHRIDADHDQEGGHGAVISPRPGTVEPVSGARPAVQPVPLRPVQEELPAPRKPIWDKNNFGFWLTVCILISLVFSIVWRSLG
jgi:hypothetical protein